MKTSFRDVFCLTFHGLWLTALAACGGGSSSPAPMSTPAPAPMSTYTIGGSVFGLTGSGLVLQNNAGDDLSISAAGAFTFATAVANGAAYAVTVKTQPSSPAQNCVVYASPGVVLSENVADVVVICTSIGRFAYAVNAGDNAITVYSIDSTTGALTAAGTPVPTGRSPYAIAARPDGQYVYVVNQISNDISVYAVNATSGALTEIPGSPFSAGLSPQALAFDPSGTYLYVANQGSDNLSAYAVSPSSGALAPLSTPTYATGTGPSAVAVSSDGSFVFVANHGGSNDISVFAVTAATGALTPAVGSPFAAGGNPRSLVLTPFVGNWDDGSSVLYTANFDGTSSTISAFFVDQNTGGLTAVMGSPVALPVSNYMATDQNGLYLYVTTGTNVVGYNLDNVVPTALPGFPLASGGNAYSVAVDPSNLFFYVANEGSANIAGYKLNAANGALTAVPGSPFAAGSQPEFIAII